MATVLGTVRPSSGLFRQLRFQLFFLMATPPAPTVTLATSCAPSTSSVPTVTTSVASSSSGSDLATRVLQSLLQSAQRLGIPPPTSSLTTSTGSSTPSVPSTETGECHRPYPILCPFLSSQHNALLAPSVSNVGGRCKG